VGIAIQSRDVTRQRRLSAFKSQARTFKRGTPFFFATLKGQAIMKNNQRISVVVAFIASALIAAGAPDVANARPPKPKIPGSACTIKELDRIADGLSQQINNTCLAQGRVMYCSEGRFSCCDESTGACTASHPVPLILSQAPTRPTPRANPPAMTPKRAPGETNGGVLPN
jgi:hypothetical protein